jgi:hypothetical protein
MNGATLNILMTALIAAAGSAVCALIGVPVWMMFAGWIAFLAGGGSVRTAAVTFVCVLLGVLLGVVGAFTIARLTASLSGMALPVGVFVIVAAALAAQFFPVINSVIGYFCGMTIFFASGLPLAPSSLLIISTGVAIGVVSGLAATILANRIALGAATRPA